MRLATVGAWSISSISFRVICGLAINKLLAASIGPHGLALVGQFQNISQLLYNLVGATAGSGVVRMTVTCGDDKMQCNQVWKTALGFALALSLVCAGAHFGLAFTSIPGAVLGRQIGPLVVIALAASIPFYTLMIFVNSVLNGKLDVSSYYVIGLAQALLQLVLVAAFSYGGSIYGAMIAFCLTNMAVAVLAFRILLVKPWFDWKLLRQAPFASSALRDLFHYSVMALSSALAINLAQISIRTFLMQSLGTSSAGYWDAIIRISTTNWTFIAAAMVFYYVPKLTAAVTRSEVWLEVRHGMSVIIPAIGLTTLVLYLFRESIVIILFSKSFLPMTELFGWQLAGDVLRVVSWFYAYLLIARLRAFEYVAIEIGTNLGYAVLVSMLVPQWGLEGAVVAHFIAYAGLITYIIVRVVTLKFSRHSWL